MSFSFTVKDERWTNLDTDLPTREILKFQKIYEISALWSPQYDVTNVTARDETLDSVDKLALDNAKSAVLDNAERRRKLLIKTLV